MIFSYRTRRAFRRFTSILLTIVALTVVVLLCWLLWLQRFIVYTADGAVLDMNLSQSIPQGVPAKPKDPPVSVPLYYGQEDPVLPPPVVPEVKPLSGYYVTVDELVADIAAVEAKLLALPQDTPVLLDVKGTWGYFFYPTAVGRETSESFDMALMQRFFTAVNSCGLYTIARLPAFRDYDFARHNFTCGLPTANNSLWADADNCYWLDPTDDTVLTYLIQITKELQGMGFDEVVFKDFCFPDTQDIVFEGDRAAALSRAARTMVATCASDSFTVSFLTSDYSFQLPEGNCRLYLQDVAAANVADVLSWLTVSDPARQVVFFAQTNDTRYESCGVLRPIDMAH